MKNQLQHSSNPQIRLNSDDEHDQSKHHRKRKLAVSILPSACTVFNGLAGFAAIHFATRAGMGLALPKHLMWAGWLIFLAMVFDMLDGRLARMTKQASDFGGQLDSLCDVISFGVAPAILMLRTVQSAIPPIDEITWWPEIMPSFTIVERAVWCIAAVYVACTVLRLARFNVENDTDESHHMTFKGLPSPAAAGAVIALVLLFAYLCDSEEGWKSLPAARITISIILPVFTLAAALLMVSNFTYPHLANQFQFRQKPFGYIVKLIILGIFMVLEPILTLAAFALIFALSGPIGALWKKFPAKKPLIKT